MKDKLTASEAVYGFAAWLTCRDETVIVGSIHNAAEMAYLVSEFCKENSLSDPRDGWENNLIHPSGECSGPALTDSVYYQVKADTSAININSGDDDEQRNSAKTKL